MCCVYLIAVAQYAAVLPTAQQRMPVFGGEQARAAHPVGRSDAGVAGQPVSQI